MRVDTEIANQRERVPSFSAQSIIIIGFVLAVSVGFFDTIINILSKPAGLSSFIYVSLPLLATICFFFLIYLAFWFLIVSHAGRFLKLESVPLALSLALFLGMFFILSSFGDLSYSRLSPVNLFNLLIALSVSFVVSVATYFSTQVIIQIPKYRYITTFFSLLTPFILAETTVFLWLYAYRVGSFLSVEFLFVSVGYILIVLLTAALFGRLGNEIKIVLLLAIFVMLFVSVPLLASSVTKDYRVSGIKKGHKIKHVILIIVDTLRADVLSCYHQKQSVSTPYIDQLARDGVLFRKAISNAPWTLPSVASIMTGLNPLVHMTTEPSSKLPDNLKTLAEYMHEAGYFTGAIGYNRFLTPDYNISQGFIEYKFFPKPSVGKSFGVMILEQIFPGQLKLDASTDDLTRLAINWIESNYRKDFFLWIHYFDPHAPYAPPSDFLPKGEPPPAIGRAFSNPFEIRGGFFTPSLSERQWMKKLYDGEVRYVDDNIGKLISALKSLNIYDESLIVLTSDHGEEFWEHGGYEHGHSLYNELLWVPLIIKTPMTTPQKQVYATVSTRSIMPTILDFCGIDYDGDNYPYANSLSTLWEQNRDGLVRNSIVSTGLLYFDEQESVISDNLKYINSLVENREELFDLARDPGERISIASSSPEEIKRARNILKEKKKAARETIERHQLMSEERAEFNEETKKELKSLGYIQ